MKRYISAILIPALLLQFFGCYSYRDITINELRQYSGTNEIRIQTDSTKLIISRTERLNEKMDWQPKDSSIVIINDRWESLMDTTSINRGITEIEYTKIGRAEISEFNLLKTVLFSAGLTVVILFAFAGLLASQNQIMNNPF